MAKKEKEEKIIEGYVIVQPGKHGWKLCSNTFGQNKMEAWLRQIQRWTHHPDPIDHPMLIQRWMDKGYRLKKATLFIDDKNEDEDET